VQFATATSHGPSQQTGYWTVASDGGIFSYGPQFYGSMGDKHLNAPVVAMASTNDAGGYWEVASDGGIFTFGDANFHGSMGGQHLNKPVVGMAPNLSGKGYWLAASDGGIFAFGDATYSARWAASRSRPDRGHRGHSHRQWLLGSRSRRGRLPLR